MEGDILPQYISKYKAISEGEVFKSVCRVFPNLGLSKINVFCAEHVLKRGK